MNLLIFVLVSESIFEDLKRQARLTKKYCLHSNVDISFSIRWLLQSGLFGWSLVNSQRIIEPL